MSLPITVDRAALLTGLRDYVDGLPSPVRTGFVLGGVTALYAFIFGKPVLRSAGIAAAIGFVGANLMEAAGSRGYTLGFGAGASKEGP